MEDLCKVIISYFKNLRNVGNNFDKMTKSEAKGFTDLFQKALISFENDFAEMMSMKISREQDFATVMQLRQDPFFGLNESPEEIEFVDGRIAELDRNNSKADAIIEKAKIIRSNVMEILSSLREHSA